MTETPWREPSALIRDGRDPDTNEVIRTVVMEAPLIAIVEQIAAMPRAARERLKIMLPDRRVAPYQYDGHDLDNLVAALRILPYSERV